MRKFRKCALLLTLVLMVAGGAPSARAIDPVTMAILAPLALKAARKASPYVIHAMQCTGTQLVSIGSNMLEIFLLPWGALQITFGAPLGFARSGMNNILSGGFAPFKLAWNTFLLPLAIFGIAGSG